VLFVFSNIRTVWNAHSTADVVEWGILNFMELSLILYTSIGCDLY